MSNNNGNNTSTPLRAELVPKLRFKEFEDSGEWEEIGILEIATMKARIGWQNLRKEEHLEKGKYYLITGTDFINNTINWEKVKYVDYERFIQDENIILKEGDILITKDGSIGKVAFVENINEKKSTLNNGIFRIRLIKHHFSKFIFYTFLSQRFSSFLDKLSGGSSIVHLYQKDFEKYELIIPKNPKEQEKIAYTLSSLDEIITAESQKLEVLKEHKKGLLQNLFPQEGETVPKLRFKEFEYSGVWDYDSVENLVSIITPPKKLNSSEYLATGKYPIVDQSQNFYCGWTNDIDALLNKYLPLIVFGDHTCILKLVDEPFAQGADGIKIIKPNNSLTTEFIFQHLNFNGVKQDGYKRHYSILKDKIVSYPNINSGEQQKIASCLSSIDELITAQTKKIEALKLHKKGLLQGLFPDVNPVDY